MKKRWSSLDSFCLSPVNHVDNSLNESTDILWNNRLQFAMPFTKYSVDSLSIDRGSRAHRMNINLKWFSFAYTIFATIDSITAHRYMCYLQWTVDLDTVAETILTCDFHLNWKHYVYNVSNCNHVWLLKWSFHHWIGTCVRLSVFDDWLIWRCFVHFDSHTNTNLHKRSTFASLKKWNAVPILVQGTGLCTLHTMHIAHQHWNFLTVWNF